MIRLLEYTNTINRTAIGSLGQNVMTNSDIKALFIGFAGSLLAGLTVWYFLEKRAAEKWR